jgi:hypothetical protein
MATYIGRVLVDVCMWHCSESTAEQCDIHTPTRTLLIYAATSPPI